jgi:Leucine-rich repeat (LRR) protein
VAALKNLEALDLSWSNIGEEDLAQAALPRKLNTLGLAYVSGIRDEGLALVSKLTQLKALDLTQNTMSRITDKGIAHLSQLSI